MATVDRYKIELDTRQANTALGGLRTAVKGFIGVLAAREVIQFGQSIIESTRKFQTYENQLRLITQGTEDLNRVMALLQQSAINSRTSFEGFLDLFVKLRVTTEALGISEARVISVTEKLSQALQVAGADAATANAVIRQFGQAMASGEVRGDEFRSIVEGLGPALAIMARESGLNVGELRKLSREGKLSAEVMFEMFEASNALSSAFNTQKITVSQLETALSDAFDRAKVKLGEVTGATSFYQSIVENLTRRFDQFSDAEGALVNKPLADLVKEIRDGSFSAVKGLEEVENRLQDLRAKANLPGNMGMVFRSDYQDQKNELLALIEEFKVLAEIQSELEAERAAATKKAAEDQAELVRLIKEQVKGVDALKTKAVEYGKLDFGTPLEKANKKLQEAQRVLSELEKAQAIINENQKLNKDGLIDYSIEIDNAKAAIAGFKKEIAELQDITLETFYADLIENSQEAAEKIDFTKQSLARLKKEFEDGVISQEVYTQALKILGKELEKIDKNTREINRNVRDFKDTLSEGISDSQLELDSLNMDPLQKQIAQIEQKFAKDLKRQIKELQDLQNEANADEINKAIEDITNASNEALKQQKILAEQAYEQQRSFEYGWKKAFDEYADNATNAARAAERIFQQTTRTMEDTIVNFAKTGKFEFRGLINDILEQLLRSQIQQLLAKTFGAFNSRGGASSLGNLFGGFFANGGTLPSGKFGIAGEAGPELITGPATVTPLSQLGGSGNVTYNINAVDASSFKSLVARDPGFIHSVAQQGARKVPGRR